MDNNFKNSVAKTSEQLTPSDNDKFTNENEKFNNEKYIKDFKILIEAEKNLDSKKKEIDDKLKKMEEHINKIEDKVKSEKSTLISIFGIFASIVTFLSLEIQILKAVCDYKIFIGISLIIIGSLLLFNVFLNLLGKEWLGENNNNMSKVEKIILGIAIILLIGGCGFSYLGDEQKCSEKKYLKFEADIEKRIDTIDKKYYKTCKDLILNQKKIK